MAHKYKIGKYLYKVLDKLKNKDKKIYEQILEKINEIINSNNIEHYKNLRYNMQKFKRVHIGSFVLVFKFDKQNDIVFFTDFNHHDKIYK